MFLKELETMAKAAKQKALAASDHGTLPPTIVVRYDGRVQAVVTAPRCDLRRAVGVLPMLRLGCRPDEIALILDVYAKPTPAGADVAKDYTAGSLQAAVRAGNRGDIVDALTVTVVDRAGVVGGGVYPYDLRDGVVVYREPYNTGPDSVGGGVPAALKGVMAMPELEDTPGIGEAMSVIGAGLSPERRRYHAGNAALNLLKEAGYAVDDRRDVPAD